MNKYQEIKTNTLTTVTCCKFLILGEALIPRRICCRKSRSTSENSLCPRVKATHFTSLLATDDQVMGAGTVATKGKDG